MKIQVIRTFGELAPVQQFWEQWQDHANNDRAHFELVCSIRPEIVSPCVTIVQKDSQTCALLAGRLERTRFAPAIGYLKPFVLRANVVAVIHRGVIGGLDEEIAAQCVDSFRALLRAGLADAVEFHYLQEDSPLMAALAACGSPWLRRTLPRWSTHRAMVLPREGGFMNQKIRAKHRTQLRKRQTELESDFDGRMSWRWLAHCDDVPALCAALEAAATRTYQRGLGVGFMDGPEYRQRLALFASRGQLRVQLLEIDDEVRAFWFGTVYGGVFHSSETGYDPELRRYEVGTLIFIRMIDELVNEGVEGLDFGLGDALYKERFSDRSWRETSVWLFAPTLKGAVLRAVLELAVTLDSAARSIVTHVGLTEKLRRFWRRRLTGVDIASEPVDAPTWRARSRRPS